MTIQTFELFALGGPAHGRRIAAPYAAIRMFCPRPDARAEDLIDNDVHTYSARRVLLPGWRVTFRVWVGPTEPEPGAALPGSLHGVALEECRL